MTARKVYDDPSTVTPIDGEVVVEGPDSVGVSLTPAAANETAKRLQDGAAEAQGQPTREHAIEDDED